MLFSYLFYRYWAFSCALVNQRRKSADRRWFHSERLTGGFVLLALVDRGYSGIRYADVLPPNSVICCAINIHYCAETLNEIPKQKRSGNSIGQKTHVRWALKLVWRKEQCTILLTIICLIRRFCCTICTEKKTKILLKLAKKWPVVVYSKGVLKTVSELIG